MDPERDRRANDIYRGSLDLPEAEQQAFIEAECGDDTRLLHAVQEMLDTKEYTNSRDPFREHIAQEINLYFQAIKNHPVYLAPGDIINDFCIIDIIGKGGMGVVYLAEDEVLGRHVAIKFLKTSATLVEKGLERFKREARIIAQLNHPNIVTLYLVGEYQDAPYMVMELVEGTTLDKIIPEEGMDRDTFVKYSNDILDAMIAAHNKGVVHRDLKPGNIMVTHDGMVKILDFGLAQRPPKAATGEPAANDALTRDGQIMGTPPYMSPEQIQGEVANARTDQFSLGVVFYQMLTNRRPFKGNSDWALKSAINFKKPPLVTELNERLPEYLGPVIERCLAKDPEQRYPSLIDVKNAFERPTPGSPDKAPSPPKPLIGWASGFLTLLLAVFLYIFWPDWEGPIATPHQLFIAPFTSQNVAEEKAHFLSHLIAADLEHWAPRLDVSGVHPPDTWPEVLKDPTLSSELKKACEEKNISLVLRGTARLVKRNILLSLDILDPEHLKKVKTVTFRLEPQQHYMPDAEDIGFLMQSLSVASEEERSWRAGRNVTALTRYFESLDLNKKEKYPEAISKLESALDLDPDFALGHAKLSSFYSARGNKHKALASAEAAFNLRDQLPQREEYLVKGNYFLNTHQYKEARDEFEKLVQIDPNGFNFRQLSHCYERLEQPEKVVDALGQTVSPDSSAINQGSYAMAIVDNGEAKKALGVLDKWRENGKNEPHHEWARGLAWLSLGETARAEAAFKRMYESAKKKKDWSIYKRVAKLLLAKAKTVQGRFGDAVGDLDASLHLDGKEGDESRQWQKRLSLTRLRLWLGETEWDTLEELEKQEPIPSLTPRYREAALLSLDMNRVDKAQAFLERIQQNDAKYPSLESKVCLAQVQGEFDRLAEASTAEQHFREAYLEMNDAKSLFYLARYLYMQKRYEESRGYLNRLVNEKAGRVMRGDLPDYWVLSHFYLARCHEVLGEAGGAITRYEQFLGFWGEHAGDLAQVIEARQRYEALTSQR